MKNNLLLTTSFLLICITLNYSLKAQNGSTWIEHTLPYDSGWVSDIVYVDSVTAWAIGQDKHTDKAVIISNLDNGTIWSLRDESLSGTLNSLHMVDRQTGYAVGKDDDNGRIAMLKTSDGINWVNQALPEINGSLFDVEFSTKQKGCAVGVNTQGAPDHFTIIYTEGGETWQEANFPDVDDGALRALSFPTPDTGWCVGNNWLNIDSCYILNTFDGGKNWELVDHPITDGMIRGVDFWSADSGFVYGMAADTNFIMLTFDGGQNWELTGTTGESSNNSSVKSAVAPTDCQKTVLSVFYYYSYYNKATGTYTWKGWKVVRYSGCQVSDGEKLVYFTLTFRAGQQLVYEETGYEDALPEDIGVNTYTSIALNGDEEGQGNGDGTSPSIIAGGSNNITHQPVVLQNIPGIEASRDENNVLTINMQNTNTANLSVNSVGEVTVNGVSTGYDAGSVDAIIISGGNQENTIINATGINDENHGSIQTIISSSGAGGGIHSISGSNSESITNTILGTSGYTFASGGQGNDKFINAEGSEGVFYYGHGGNDSYSNASQSEDSQNMGEKSASLNVDTIKFSDQSGNDTLIYKDYGWTVNIIIDLNESQQISSGQMLELDGQFENFIGSDYDDKITVKPLTDELRLIDGGPHENGDTLVVDALGKPITDNGSTILAEGCQPINYINIEQVIITNFAAGLEKMAKSVNSGLDVYPNPFSKVINLKSMEEADISIVNVNGQVIDKLRLKQNTIFEWKPDEAVPSGIYFINFRARGYSTTRKVVFMR